MTVVALHGHQFVLGPAPVRDDWVHEELPGTGHLSRSPWLSAHTVRDLDGATWCVLGAAWAEPRPWEQLARAHTADVPRLYRSWSGRWVLVGNGEVHMDAAGLLGCFFRDGWVSSSAALLVGSEKPTARPFIHGVGLDWVPLPASRFAGLRRLLPSQVLRVPGEITARPLLEPRATLSYEETLAELGRLLLAGVRAASEEGALHVALTSGFDSRLVLAAARAAGLSPRTYTQIYPGMTRADRDLPPLLARAVGCEHARREAGAFSQERARVFDEHTAGHCIDRDREFVARGQWDWLGEKDVVLRGGGFEIGRCGFYPELGEGPVSIDSIFRTFPTRDEASRAAMEEWLRWCARHPEPMDDRDRFYWEQRVGGWLSTVEQALDLLPGTRGHLANSFRFYELALTLPLDVRWSSKHHTDLVATFAPELARFPVNQRDPWLVRMRRKTLHKLREWCLRLAPA